MGSSQKLATVVMFGLVALSTVLFLYFADESNRISAEQEEQQEVAIERATANYIQLCLQCHGPAGEGYTAPGEGGTGRIGAPLGGVNTSLNQEGINSQGTPVAGGVDGRAVAIHDRIVEGLQFPDGSVRMPAFAAENGGPLNDEQINELVIMIQHVDWNEVYNESITTFGGYPTPPPAAATEEAEEPEPTDQAGGEAGETVTIVSVDIAFDPATVTIPADTDVTFELPNDGAAPHNLSIDELGVSVDLPVGATESVIVNAPAGEYEYYCNVPGHKEGGMVGTLIVE